jgi:hypothetical protein
MEVAELAFACYLYGCMTDDDKSYRRLLEKTRPRLDLTDADHREALLVWLNSWGCRQFAVRDHELASDEIFYWYQCAAALLCAPATTLLEFTENDFASATRAYAGLVNRHASNRNLGKERIVRVDFGPTAAAKILFALRPKALPPWDIPIRGQFDLYGSGAEYGEYLRRVRSDLEHLNAKCCGLNLQLSQLPVLFGRPNSSLAKLVDEYYWVTLTRNCAPPSREQMTQWVQWSAQQTESIKSGGGREEEEQTAAGTPT